MSKTPGRRRVSRDDWLQRGLEVLRESGVEVEVEVVKIDHLARSLGVAKTGFYWHFENRAELLESMLEYWARRLRRLRMQLLTRPLHD
jgi:AcrR family transcriptional regulator